MTRYNKYLLTNVTEFTLEESRFENLVERAKKINKKMNREFVSVNVIKEDFRRNSESGVTYKYITFTLNHSFCQLNEWKVLARKSLIDNSVVIDVFENSSSISSFRNDNFSCDHCSTNRSRKVVFIIFNQNSGEVKQVGKACLKDFTGESITEFLKEVDSVQSLFEFDNISDSIGYFDLVDFFAKVNRLVKKGLPYKNKSFLNDSTVKKAFESYSQDNLPISEEEQEESRKIMKWFIESNKNSDKDFILNAVSIIQDFMDSERSVSIRSLYRIAFVPYSYKTFSDKQKAYKANLEVNNFKGGYLEGNIGDKFILKCKLISVKSFSRFSYHFNDDGISYIYTFIDEFGHKLIWITSKENYILKDKENQIFNVKGFIKKFSKFNGIEQTEIIRCFISDI